jgi:eukaryotic-like serine/threonine-protein kinase
LQGFTMKEPAMEAHVPPSEGRTADPDTNKSVHQGGQASTELEATRAFSESLADPDSPARLACGKFTILRRHAVGGLGQVSVARDDRLRRQVALKEIRPDRLHDASLRQRFITEAEITGQLEHPGVIPIYAFEEDEEGRPYYAMRFIEGRTLAEAIEAYHCQPTPLGFRDLLKHFVDICQTMSYAHSKGVIHRDLKPANIMLGDFSETWVVDWGLAKRMATQEKAVPPDSAQEKQIAEGITPSSSASPLTETGQALGTPGYMSPEQAAGQMEQIAPATDIYALGAILYKLLTNKTPYKGSTAEILEQVKRGQPVAPATTVGRGVPPALEAIRKKAMSYDPKERYASAGDLADDVNRWLADEPVGAWRESFSLRARRWMRRHRLLVTGGVAALAVGVIALGAGLFFVNAARTRESAARQLAEQRFKSERDAIKQFYTDVAANSRLLRKEPGTQELRKILLGKARDYYEKFLQEYGDEPDLLADVAEAYYHLGRITSEIDPGRKALTYLERALEIREHLAQAAPDSLEKANELSWVQNEIGIVYSRDLREQQKAIAFFNKARAVKEHLLQSDPENRQFAHNLARTLYNLGAAQVQTGEYTEAGVSFTSSLELLKKLMPEHPGAIDLSEDLGKVYFNQAALAFQTNHFAEAEAGFRRTREEIDKALGKNPRSTESQVRLAACYFNEGMMHQQRNKLELASEAFNKGQKIQEQIVHDNPDAASYSQDLARTYYQMALIETKAGRVAKALPLCQKAQEVMEQVVTHDPLESGFATQMLEIYSNIAFLLYQTGQREEVIPAWKKARQAIEKKAGENQQNSTFLHVLAQVDNNLGALYIDMGKDDEARKAFERALDTLAKIQDETTARQKSKLTASINFNLGLLAFNGNQAEEAITYYEKSLALHQDKNVYHQDDLANVSAIGQLFMSIGDCYRILHNYGKAREFYDQAVANLEPLVRNHHDQAIAIIDLSNTYGNRGTLEKSEGKLPAALIWYDKSTVLLEALLKEKGRNVWAENSLAVGHFNKAETFTLLGRHEEALKEWDKTLPYDRPQDRDETRIKRAGTLARLGRIDEAVKDALGLVGKQTAKGATFYDAACIFALASASVAKDPAITPEKRDKQSKDYTRQALEFLIKARTLGYFKSGDKRTKLAENKDFDAIRSSPEFKTLLVEISKNEK